MSDPIDRLFDHCTDYQTLYKCGKIAVESKWKKQLLKMMMNDIVLILLRDFGEKSVRMHFDSLIKSWREND